MWDQITVLLGIKVEEKDLEAHIEEIAATTAWLQENYGEKLTCEEIVNAYNLACQRNLKLKELFGLISPKHVGDVLDAYRTYVREDLEINRVFAQQLLLDQEPRQTEEEITAFMESALEKARAEVAAGKFYFDAGNGLFDWLYQNGRITIDENQADHFYKKAKQQLPKLLEREKKDVTPGDTGKQSQLEKLIQHAEMGLIGADHHARIEAYAKRLFLNHYLTQQP
ncbi:hypothetical protein [Spirosoma agri]|uniref:Uncharacterized protein n=1 Tax=Spirosoma agri TaxID=1987381 RepID=A0A6M0IJ09_9BACT|nr:hypothetical protein [Spirosoma agri]NEU68276.1 hypothetical protein [Spirosoma agri]